MNSKYATSAKVAAIVLIPAAGFAGTIAAASAAPQPRPPATVTLRDQAGQYVQVGARGNVTVGYSARNAARFIKVTEPRGQYELQYGQGRNAKYLTVSSFGASLGRQGTHFAPGQDSRSHRYATIKINRNLLTAQGSHLIQAARGRHGPTPNQEWAK